MVISKIVHLGNFPVVDQGAKQKTSLCHIQAAGISRTTLKFGKSADPRRKHVARASETEAKQKTS